MLVEPLVTTTSTSGGRPPEIDLRAMVNARLYRTRTGGQWRLFPSDVPPMSAIRSYVDTWNADGTFIHVNDVVQEMARTGRNRDKEPSRSVRDSPSVKTTDVGGERGFDGGTKGERPQATVLG